ncbi:YcdB/YcdC domain-containing protein [Brevibacillus dissolubilis]|uniref:YcdB/YcdC domain-containing protein n=1 Tax=Brevibacillus dissolubilis TaxID=1844116 RepID=UPI001115B1E4|nr:YcdB/YcdC domain-containing protein [Brevibacillus dissolubilis]
MSKRNTILAGAIAISLLTANPLWIQPAEASQPAAKAATQSGNKETAQQTKAQQNEAKRIPPQKVPKEMTDTITKLTRILPEIDGLKVSYAEIDFDRDDREVWDFYLVKPDDSDEDEDEDEWYDSVFASVTVYADTGELIQYEIENPEWTSTKLPTTAFAERKAKDFLKKVMGDATKEYVLNRVRMQNYSEDEIEYDGEIPHAEVYYEQLINGIPVNRDALCVTVDAQGHTLSYENSSIAYDPQDFPKPEGLISLDAAAQKYQAKLGLHKSYYTGLFNPFSSSANPRLVYETEVRGGIDPHTGEYIVIGESDEPFHSEVVQVQPTKPVRSVTNREEAEAVIESLIGVDLSSYRFKENDEDYYIEYLWMKTDEDTETSDYIRMEVNVEEGRIEGFYRDYDMDRADEANPTLITKEAALETAMKAMEQYLDPSVTQLNVTHMDLPYVVVSNKKGKQTGMEQAQGLSQFSGPAYELVFHPVHQDVVVKDFEYRIQIDPNSGKITSVKLGSSSYGELPPNVRTVSIEQATKTYLKNNPLALKYDLNEDMDEPTPILIYMPKKDQVYVIDAYTGKAEEFDEYDYYPY